MRVALEVRLALALVAALPTMSHADSVLVMPVVGDVVDGDQERITASLHTALGARAHQAIAQSQRCETLECVNAQVVGQGADAGVLVRVFRDNGELSELAVAVVHPNGRHGNGRTQIHGNLVNALTEALDSALRDTGGETYSVRIEGEPVGASLTLDGDVAGTLPTTVELSAGEHTLTVAMHGYEDHHETLSIDSDRTLIIALRRGDSSNAPSSSGGSVSGAGIALLVSGLALGVGEGIAALVLRGCEEEIADGCRDKELGVGLGVGWAVGAAALSVIGLVLILTHHDEPEQRVRIGVDRLEYRRAF